MYIIHVHYNYTDSCETSGHVYLCLLQANGLTASSAMYSDIIAFIRLMERGNNNNNNNNNKITIDRQCVATGYRTCNLPFFHPPKFHAKNVHYFHFT